MKSYTQSKLPVGAAAAADDDVSVSVFFPLRFQENKEQNNPYYLSPPFWRSSLLKGFDRSFVNSLKLIS